MFDFLKNLFGGGYENLVEKQIELDEYEAEIKNAPKNISEPIISFVECFKANPKRFTLKYHWHRYGNIYKLLDKITKQEWEFYSSAFTYGDIPQEDKYKTYSGYPDFLSECEKDYLYTHISAAFLARKARFDTIKQERKERQNMSERKRLISIYCKE